MPPCRWEDPTPLRRARTTVRRAAGNARSGSADSRPPRLSRRRPRATRSNTTKSSNRTRDDGRLTGALAGQGLPVSTTSGLPASKDLTEPRTGRMTVLLVPAARAVTIGRSGPSEGVGKAEQKRACSRAVGIFGDPGPGWSAIAEARTKKAAWRPTIVKISPVKLCSARAFDGAENHD